MSPLFAQNSGGESTGDLNIETKTAQYSADYHLGNQKNAEEDQKRTVIGVGEIVRLTLTGKGIDDKTDVKWTASGGGASVEGRKSTATLQAHISGRDSTCTVTASVKGRDPASVTFEIKSMKFGGKEIITSIPPKEGCIGPGGHITVVAVPTCVSFSSIELMEEDAGTVASPGSQKTDFSDEIYEHNPSMMSVFISEINEFTDEIRQQPHVLPQK